MIKLYEAKTLDEAIKIMEEITEKDSSLPEENKRAIEYFLSCISSFVINKKMTLDENSQKIFTAPAIEVYYRREGEKFGWFEVGEIAQRTAGLLNDHCLHSELKNQSKKYEPKKVHYKQK